MGQADRDYVLGTHDDELLRLGRQHDVWRAAVHDCWHRAGIGQGAHVVDIGAGPGYATWDLAQLVGTHGRVDAIERSQRFVEATRARCDALPQVAVHEHDLMSAAPLPVTQAAASWCRWVTSFVDSPRRLVEKIHAALQPGAVAMFHEYIDYRTFQLMPQQPAVRSFVEQVMGSWRAVGGEPDAAAQLLPLLVDRGRFSLRWTRPHVLSASPSDPVWMWPAEFIDVSLKRLHELGTVNEAWVQRVQTELAAAADDPHSVIITPMMLEIVAVRR